MKELHKLRAETVAAGASLSVERVVPAGDDSIKEGMLEEMMEVRVRVKVRVKVRVRKG